MNTVLLASRLARPLWSSALPRSSDCQISSAFLFPAVASRHPHRQTLRIPWRSISSFSSSPISCTSSYLGGPRIRLSLRFYSSSRRKIDADAAAAAAADAGTYTGTRNPPARGTRLSRRAWKAASNHSIPAWALAARRRYANPPRRKSHPNSSSGCERRNPSKSSPPSSKSLPTLGNANHESFTTSVSKYLHLPTMPHAPTKEELLAAATGFWSRMKVRFKWVSIRSMRPWNVDEWGAFVSWFMLGHLVWILVGTTTFVSILILGINTVFAQETLARWVGDYLTQSAGVTVVFESAIVPRWKDGVITFRNVFVSRRPGQTKSSVSKGSSSSAAAVAAAGRHTDPDAVQEEEDDGNYTQFDLTLSAVNVTLSFYRWWNGKGLLKDVEVKGVRGVIDRTNVKWPGEYVDPLSYRRTYSPGDFELEYFKLEDLLVNIHQPNGFRPFSVSIFSCELPQLRKHYLFYDFLSANHMSGAFDGSLFTIHPRQIHGVASGDTHHMAENDGEEGAWKKYSRMRVDGLRIDHLNRGVEGPFGWIYDGNVDIVADVMFPADPEEGLSKVVSEFYDKLEDAVTSNRHLRQIPQILQKRRGTTASKEETDHEEPAPPKVDRSYFIMDMRIHMNDVKAAVPLFRSNMSYVNQALVRPIVAYINAKRTYIPINCRIVKRLSDFEGSWTFYDCGLMDDMSAETYQAFARDVEDQHTRVRRFKKVGFWTLSLAVHALFMGMAGNVI